MKIQRKNGIGFRFHIVHKATAKNPLSPDNLRSVCHHCAILCPKSLHVLWVEYCRATGAKAVDLDKVYEKECANEDQVVLDFTGDLNLAEGWSTTKYLDSQPTTAKNPLSPDNLRSVCHHCAILCPG